MINKEMDEETEMSVEGFLEELSKDIPTDKQNNKSFIAKAARQKVKMTIRHLAGALNLPCDFVLNAENETDYYSPDYLNDAYYVAVLFACCTRSIASKVRPEGICPDCGRRKARDLKDVEAGLCPKWWAIFDEAADNDCEMFKNRMLAGEE